MSRINVIVAATRKDLDAEGIATAVAGCADMCLVAGHYLTVSEADALLPSLPPADTCALLLYGPADETARPGEAALAKRPDVVVLRVNDVGNVRIGGTLHALGHTELLAELRSLVKLVAKFPYEHSRVVQLRAIPLRNAAPPSPATARRDRHLLNAAANWIHEVLRDAIAAQSGGSGDLPGLTVTSATVQDSLQKPAGTAPEPPAKVKAADAALTEALAAVDDRLDPLAVIARVSNLSSLEFRMLLLALAPEIDPRYQRCISFLLDDLSRRVGTLGLYATLLGEPSEVRLSIAHSGNLARWQVLDGRTAILSPADEPLRVDPFIVGWILGQGDALGHDPRVRRTMRLTRWPGARLLDLELDRDRAVSIVGMLQTRAEFQWFLFAGDDAPGWRAILELGAELQKSPPVRVDANRLTGLDAGEIEESGLRLGRMVRFTGRPLVIDVTLVDEAPQEDDALRVFFAAIRATGARPGVICTDEARIVRLIGSVPYSVLQRSSLQASARSASMRAAARGAEVTLGDAQAETLANQYPLHVDGLEQAMRVAYSRRQPNESNEARSARFVNALKTIAAEGVSRLAERIAPEFKLDDIVLPPDRKRQLQEIVDNIRLAAHVLDGWRFGEQLPYGRGVTALFHGPSGTGKTMAAMGLARRLDIQILRLDFSRVVSKYIGDTEKNIDRVFNDAQKSGSAILIDEADALLGKRSEVKDAHDRYANIEVAYLLQRMEAYEGLAILTTNLRQNLDAAFLRRLRFIVDFPRPDAAAREEIWRRCLPEKSHALDAAAFRLLARKIELTGGHIRQITLRAAFVAAADNKSIGLAHVAYAANAELEKLGKPAVVLELPDERRAA